MYLISDSDASIIRLLHRDVTYSISIAHTIRFGAKRYQRGTQSGAECIVAVAGCIRM